MRIICVRCLQVRRAYAVARPLLRVRILILFILFVRIFPHFRQQNTSEASNSLAHKHTDTDTATQVFRVTYRVRGLLTITTSSGAMSLSMCIVLALDLRVLECIVNCEQMKAFV